MKHLPFDNLPDEVPKPLRNWFNDDWSARDGTPRDEDKPKPRRRRVKQGNLFGTRGPQSRSKAHTAPTEDQEQGALVKWLRAQRVAFTAIPNGAYLFGGRVDRARQWAKLQRTGCQKGFPDLLIFTPPPNSPGCPGVAVEMKRTKGGRVSDEQRAWLDALEGYGWKAIVAKGCDSAVKQLRELGYG